MPKFIPFPAPTKKAAAKKAAKPAAMKAAAAADAALDTKPEAGTEAVSETAPAAETTAETVQREAPPMQAAGEPTDFDNLVDCARVVDKTFGSEMPKEGTNNFLIRLLTAISNTTTEQFDSLSLSAQTWYENGCQEGNDKKDITPPTGYISPAAKPAAAKKAAAPKATKAPKEPKATKAPKEKKVRESSKTMPVRLAMCTDPSLTVEQLVALLPKIGRSTLATTRADVLATLNAAHKSGWTAPAA